MRAAPSSAPRAAVKAPAGSGTLLEVDRLACRFGGLQAVADATFAVRPGTITGLIGPNGAGKSTVINLVSGRTQPSAGAVRFAGEEITGRKPHEVARRGLVRTFQQANVFGQLTVVENLLVGAAPWKGEGLAAALGRAARGRATHLARRLAGRAGVR